MNRNAGSFDRLAKAYDFMARHERSPAFFLEHLPPRRRIALDVGCGTGLLTAELSQHFETVIGLDVSAQMLDVAREHRMKRNVHYVQMQAEQMGFGTTFDMVATHTTLHHVQDLDSVLESLRRFVAPGGVLVALDNVCETRKVRRRILLASPIHDFMPSVKAHGLLTAARLTLHRLRPAWLAHLASDTYLTSAQFIQRYTRALEGASISRLGVFMGAVWRAPSPRDGTGGISSEGETV